MEDHESPPEEEEEEEEEFIVLDSEHVCSFFFNIYAISINENRFCLIAPQRERLYHVLSVCLVYCCTDNN